MNLAETKRYTVVVMERQEGEWTAEVEDEDGGLMSTAFGIQPRELVVQAVHEAFDIDMELP